MPQKMTDIVLFGKEATRGTVAGSFLLDHPFLGDGLVPNIESQLAEVRSSSTWPYVTDQVPLGATADLAFTPDININTIRTLILLATKRTAGVLPAVSIAHSRVGVGDAHYLGAVAREFSLEYSRSGQQDASALLSGSMSFDCMKPANTTGVAAGTPATGRYFRLDKLVATINSVAALEVLSYSRRMTIGHALGPPDDQNVRMYLEDGETNEELTLRARFSAAAWADLVLNATEHAATFVHATGTALETLTETIAKQQISSHNLATEEGTVLEEITIKQFGANATVWTYGTAIGADPLTL